MRKNIHYTLCLCICILVLVSISGCIASPPNTSTNKTTANIFDPETGIQEWIDAVNHRDVNRLYMLSPDEIRQNISYKLFVQANENNVLFSPGWRFTNYTVLNKTVNQYNATMAVVLILQKPISENSTQMESIPVYDNFILIYEDNQWKVWT